MEWITNIIEKHKKEDGSIDMDAVRAEINTEFPKNAVPKSDFNAKVTELKTVNETLATLKDEHKDVAKLQETLTTHEATIETLRADNLKIQQHHTLENKIKEVGGKDVDYLIYKLGETEMDADGNIKDLDNKIKDLQASLPDQFSAKEPDANSKNVPDGFEPLDNKLPEGKLSEKDLATDFISALTSDLPETK